MESPAPVVALVALVMVVGVAGTVVPLIPGLGLVAAAALGYGLAEGFGTVGVAAMVVRKWWRSRPAPIAAEEHVGSRVPTSSYRRVASALR